MVINNNNRLILGDGKHQNKLLGNESWVLTSVRTQTTAPSLILKYQKNQLHYKHSYNITPRQVRVKGGAKERTTTTTKKIKLKI